MTAKAITEMEASNRQADELEAELDELRANIAVQLNEERLRTAEAIEARDSLSSQLAEARAKLNEVITGE